MHIGNNNQEIWQFFSRMNGGKANTNMLFGSGASKGNYCGNTIDDLRSGHFKNSYGVEGMGITGRCNAALYSRRKKRFIFDSINTTTALSFR